MLYVSLAAAAATQLSWPQWLPTAGELLWAAATGGVILLIGLLLEALFRRMLAAYHLRGMVRLGALLLAGYVSFHVYRAVARVHPSDGLVLWSHRIFGALVLLIGLRILDRLMIVPLLTRGGKLPLPRFVHQIIVSVVALFVALAYCNWAFELNITNVLAGSAVLSIVLGLALQETLGNFFSGMVVQASSPFVIGDWIICAGVEGRVVDMTWRTVTVQTPDANFVLIPNSVIAKEKIINFHQPDNRTARSVQVGLDYAAEPARACEVLVRAARETAGVLADPAPGAALVDFGGSAAVYSVGFWINEPARHGAIEQAVRANIWYRLKQAGIGIPIATGTSDSGPAAEKRQQDRAAARQTRLAAISTVPILAPLSAAEREQLADQARDVILGPGQVLFYQNDPGTSVYLLVQGTVDVLHQGADGRTYKITQFKDGACLGEMSTLTGQPRSVTVRTVTPITLVELGRASLSAVFKNNPSLLEKVSVLVAQRRATLQAQVAAAAAANAAATPAPEAPNQNVLDLMRKTFSFLTGE